MRLKFFIFTILVFLLNALFASECVSQKVMFSGSLKDDTGKIISSGKIVAIQNGTEIEQSTTVNGAFELRLNPGTTNLTYHAPGYKKLEDTITVEEENEPMVKTMQRDSVGGWWTLLLLVPGVCGLLVAWCKECFCKNRTASQSIQDRLLVALVNGVVWAGVLAWIWHGAAGPQGITKVQFFHTSLTFEFFVPLLGYFGSLLYVFDLFRGKDCDKFKEQEFGMRVVMGPYVAIVMVALFGKDLKFINLESFTGQGTLSFVSGLIVVVAIQGIIERANEMLGAWRRQKNPYVASPLAEKFKLNEDEDNALKKIALRYPNQLRMWTDDDLCNKLADEEFDEHLALAMKRSVESDQLKADISNMIWDRLKPLNVTTIQDFSTLSNVEIQQVAKKKPELSDERLIELRDKTIDFLKANGATLT
jgi:hypothetical protein